MALALADYQNRDMTSEEIAAKHEVSTATLTVWATKAGIPLRMRGRKKQEVPTPLQLQIVKLASVYNYDKVGQRFGKHKQSIHRIVKRWKDWSPHRKSPFVPGDVIVVDRKKFAVIDAGRHDGTLFELRTKKVYKKFSWNGGRIPRKIGVDKRFLVKR